MMSACIQSFNSLHSTNATWDMQNCTDEKVGLYTAVDLWR